MKLITLTCPKCGAQMEVNPELEAIICNYCGNKMLIDREVVEQKITGGFEFGYQQEQGRLKAQQEEQQKRIREEEKEARKNEILYQRKKRGGYETERAEEQGSGAYRLIERSFRNPR